MPTYDYKCVKCSNVQEEVHSITLTPDIKCSVCGEHCERVFSGNGNFILKGSDWPSQGFKLKEQMKKKNSRMKTKMIEREHSGEGVTRLADIKN